MEQEILKIIKDLKRGRPNAFGEIVRRYQDRLFHMLQQMVGDRHEAEDLLQETFIRVVTGIGSYRHQDRFDGWLFRIASNLACDHLRKRKAKPMLYIDSEPGALSYRNDPDRELGGRELNNLIVSAIEELPWQQRQIFLLREEGRLSFREIAQMLDIPLNTALARMHYAIKNLRSRLAKDIERDIPCADKGK